MIGVLPLVKNRYCTSCCVYFPISKCSWFHICYFLKDHYSHLVNVSPRPGLNETEDSRSRRRLLCSRALSSRRSRGSQDSMCRGHRPRSMRGRSTCRHSSLRFNNPSPCAFCISFGHLSFGGITPVHTCHFHDEVSW